MTEYKRDLKQLFCTGVDLNSPVDSIKDGFYPILENLRSHQDGVIQPRLGLSEIASGVIASQTPVHSIRRLNNRLDSTYTRVIGSGTKLATGQGAFTNVQYNGADVAFSGNPLAMVPWRPDQSPVSWMYVADSSAMYKLSYNGSAVTTHRLGIAPPTTAPTIELNTSSISGTTIGNLDSHTIFGNTANWTSDGTVAGAVGTTTRVTGVAMTAVLHDSGTTGWCSIVPASMANIGPGMVLQSSAGGAAANVREVYRLASPSGNTIARIIYDNEPANTGLCTVVPTSSVQELRRNCVVRLNGGLFYYRVIEVIKGPNSTVSAFRVNTGANTHSATQAFEVVNSFRTEGSTANLNTLATLSSNEITSTFTAGATTKGWVNYNPPAVLDMTSAVGVEVFSDEDYFHLSFKAADISQITQLRIMFDVDDDSFARNFYYRTVTPSDLTAAAKANQTILEGGTTLVETTQIRIPIFGSGLGSEPTGYRTVEVPGGVLIQAPRDVAATGDSQWSEIRFRRGDCIRVGADYSKSWAAVGAIRFEITMITGAAVTLMEFGSLVMTGGAAPDLGFIGAPIDYRYRYRSTVTGATSNWSPATRSGVMPQRGNVKVTFTTTSIPEVDVVDIQRFGGLVAAWATVGTALESAGQFIDKVGDDYAFSTLPDSVGDVHFQPWVSAQSPKSGTASTVAGTLVKDSGTNFSTSWLKGTGIKVNSLFTTIRRVLSTSLLEVEDCIGSGDNLAWEIPEPFIQTSLPCFWSANGWFFACGDSTNPGRLYWSNNNNPDSTQDLFWLDVTAPSEPLQNGFFYNGRNYIFSTENLYEIVEISHGQFISRVTPAGRGLMYRWAFAIGPKIWFLAKDGIYETDGGGATSITIHALYNFFPKEGQPGTAANGFFPPNVTSGNVTVSGITADVSRFFRLSYYDNHLYFVYPDTANKMRVLLYKLGAMSMVQGASSYGWFPDVYNPYGNNTGVTVIYGEEGDGVHNLLMGGAEATTGRLYSYAAGTDAGTNIPWHFRQASYDGGEKRADKDWKDFVISADPGSGTINVAAGINEYASTVTINNPATGAATITGASRTKATFDINSGSGVEARNLAIDMSGTGINQKLYFIEPSFAARPEDTFRRATQYDDDGYPGEKWVQGIWIEADTQNIAKSIGIQYDGGTVAETLTITHNGRRMEPYSFGSAFVARLLRLAPSDDDLFKLYKWKWVWEPEPPLVTVWDSQQTSHGHIGFSHLKEIWITHTSTADLTLTITRLDDNTSQAYTIPHSGGVRGRETRILLNPASFLKGKTFRYKITQATNTPFRIYLNNTGVLVKPWGSAQGYARWAAWGGVHGDGKAAI